MIHSSCQLSSGARITIPLSVSGLKVLICILVIDSSLYLYYAELETPPRLLWWKYNNLHNISPAFVMGTGSGWLLSACVQYK